MVPDVVSSWICHPFCFLFFLLPARGYVSPPWKRWTTADGPSSPPPCLVAPWRKSWSGKASFSQTGNYPGCKFNCPNMFWLWAALKRRASFGKSRKISQWRASTWAVGRVQEISWGSCCVFSLCIVCQTHCVCVCVHVCVYIYSAVFHPKHCIKRQARLMRWM